MKNKLFGLFVSSAFALAASGATLTHRWSFTSDYTDSVGDADAKTIGDNVTITDGQAVMTGSGHDTGSLNLGTNLLDTAAATIEIWATQNEIQNWSRIFDYGTDTGNYINMVWTYETQYFHDKVTATVGGTEAGQEYALGPHMLGVKYHFSVTIKANTSDSTTTVRFMRRNSDTGALEKDWTLTASDLYSTLSNPLFYLGRSQFNDNDAHASYDEVRIWSGILSDEQLEANAVRGPDDTTPGEELSLTGPAYATWVGTSAPESADDMENSANWSCTDTSGNAVSGAIPGTATTVIIPVSDASYFTIPTGYTPNWRAVRFGPEYAATQWGKIVYSGERYLNSNIPPDQSWIDIAHSSYTAQGTTSDPSGCLDKNALNNSQFRFDGWFYVESDKAGVWTVRTSVDDYMSLLIDGAVAGYNYTWKSSLTHYHYVSPGWHRYTLIVGDTYGGEETTLSDIDRSCITMADADKTKLTLGGLLGNECSQAGTIKLAADCNWGALGTITLTSGVTIDLNGHNLIVDDITSDYFGTQIINSSGSTATLYYSVDPSSSVGANELTIASNVTKAKATSYLWTGAAGDCKTSTPGNWMLLTGATSPAAPSAGTPLVFSASAGGIVTNDVEGLGGESVTFASEAGAFTITGNAFTGVTFVGNESAFTQTFSNEVHFAGTYLVSPMSAAVDFAGGATASEPDSSLRYVGSPDLYRTFVGNFTFTNEYWYSYDLVNNDYPWIVTNGSTVVANNFVGKQTYGTRILRVEKGGTMHAAYLEHGWDRGDIDIDGTLIVDGTLKSCAYGDINFGRDGNEGTVQAKQFYKDGGYTLNSHVPNIVIGSDGIANASEGWPWTLQANTKMTASDNFEFGGQYRSDDASDRGFHLSAFELEVEVPEDITVTHGVGMRGDNGCILKKSGAGLLVLTNGYDGTVGFIKNYAGQTIVDGGTLLVAADESVGTGAITVKDGATLKIGNGVTVGNNIVLQSGATYCVDAGVTNFIAGRVTSVGTVQINGCATLAEGAYWDVGTYEFGENGTVYVAAQATDCIVATNVTAEVFAKFSSAGKLTLGDGGAVSYSEAYVWTGTDGANWSDAANWSHNGAAADAAPIDVPTAHVYFNGAATVVLDASAAVYDITFAAETGEVVIDNPAAVGDVVTTNTLTLTKIINTGTVAPVVNCAVDFTDTYLASFPEAGVNFVGGATATYPDPSMRYDVSSDAQRTLLGDFTFTSDWIIPNISGKEIPWYVANGTKVTAKRISGEQDSRKRILYVDLSGAIYADSMELGWDKGDIFLDGYLELSGDLTLRTCPTSSGVGNPYSLFSNFGCHGTVKANSIRKLDHNVVHCYVPNLVIGKGGVGCSEKDWYWVVAWPTTISAYEDFSTLCAAASTDHPDDWGFMITSNLTFDVSAERTVTFGSPAQGTGAVIKEGEGRLVMTDSYNGVTKTYSGGTQVNGGTLAVLATESLGSDNGSVTLAAGTVLELAPGVKLGNLTPPSEGTATIKPAGEFAAGEYTLANKFSGSISNLTLDTSEMVMESRFIALLKTESETVDEEVVEKLILKVKEGGFILSIR